MAQNSEEETPINNDNYLLPQNKCKIYERECISGFENFKVSPFQS